jgi:hypothetical protein
MNVYDQRVGHPASALTKDVQRLLVGHATTEGQLTSAS